MLPTDLRNLTWLEVQAHLSDDLRRVHAAWEQHGPGTTREVAARAGISLLTLRPRTCELHKVHLVALVGKNGTEGVYRFCSVAEGEAAFAQRPAPKQPEPACRAPAVMTVTLAARIMASHRRHRRPVDSGQLQIFA